MMEMPTNLIRSTDFTYTCMYTQHYYINIQTSNCSCCYNFCFMQISMKMKMKCPHQNVTGRTHTCKQQHIHILYYTYRQRIRIPHKNSQEEALNAEGSNRTPASQQYRNNKHTPTHIHRQITLLMWGVRMMAGSLNK